MYGHSFYWNNSELGSQVPSAHNQTNGKWTLKPRYNFIIYTKADQGQLERKQEVSNWLNHYGWGSMILLSRSGDNINLWIIPKRRNRSVCALIFSESCTYMWWPNVVTRTRDCPLERCTSRNLKYISDHLKMVHKVFDKAERLTLCQKAKDIYI